MLLISYHDVNVVDILRYCNVINICIVVLWCIIIEILYYKGGYNVQPIPCHILSIIIILCITIYPILYYYYTIYY